MVECPCAAASIALCCLADFEGISTSHSLGVARCRACSAIHRIAMRLRFRSAWCVVSYVQQVFGAAVASAAVLRVRIEAIFFHYPLIRLSLEGLLDGIVNLLPPGREPLPVLVFCFETEPPVPLCLVTLFFKGVLL